MMAISLELYETNMRTLIRELKANGTYVILFTLPTVVEPGLTAEQLQERRIFFPYYAGSYSVDPSTEPACFL